MSESAIRKINALRAKARENANATEAEAMAALEKAAELMAKYGVTEAQLAAAELGEGLKRTGWRPKYKNVHPVTKYVSTAIGEFCGVAAWRRDNQSEFYGIEQDAEMAEYLTEMIANCMDGEWRTYCRENPARQGVSRHKEFWSFTAGMGTRVAARLRELVEERERAMSSDSRALVVNKQAVMCSAAEQALGLRLKTSRGRGIAADGRALGAGRSAGDRVNLSRPVGSGGAGPRLLK